MTKGPIYCECGNEKPHDLRPGCLSCRELENRRKLETGNDMQRTPLDDFSTLGGLVEGASVLFPLPRHGYLDS